MAQHISDFEKLIICRLHNQVLVKDNKALRVENGTLQSEIDELNYKLQLKEEIKLSNTDKKKIRAEEMYVSLRGALKKQRNLVKQLRQDNETLIVELIQLRKNLKKLLTARDQ